MLTHLSLDRHFLCILLFAGRSSQGAMRNEAHCKPMDPGHPIQHNPATQDAQCISEPLYTALPSSTLCLVPRQSTCSHHCCCPNPAALVVKTQAGLRSGSNALSQTQGLCPSNCSEEGGEPAGVDPAPLRSVLEKNCDKEQTQNTIKPSRKGQR